MKKNRELVAVPQTDKMHPDNSTRGSLSPAKSAPIGYELKECLDFVYTTLL